jgi:peptidoglycan-N-acetylglucosamine deacetylase
MRIIKTPLLIKWATPNLVWQLPAEKPTLYLTFDDGPIPEITPWVLETLHKYQAKATFFCVGDNVRKYPEVFQLIKDAGHSWGNHTFNHLQCTHVSRMEYLRNIQKADNLLKTNLFRPPHGKILPSLIHTLKSKYQLIMWDVMTYDFDKSLLPKQCFENVRNNAVSGSIVVMHDSLKTEKNLKYSLPATLDYYSAQGFGFAAIPMKSCLSPVR